MNYSMPLKYHFMTKKGWINDPNGLVYFNGFYHIFYQHAPDFEEPWRQNMHWGHARTKDFIHFEELPVALYPDMPYDKDGCWSGTAVVKDNILYLFYSSIHDNVQSVSVAYSSDGISFRKKDIGCMSVPREIKLIDGKIYGYPVKEVQSLLKNEDPALMRTKDGFSIKREGRKMINYKGEIKDLRIIRDEYIMEVFVNSGEEIYSALL